MAETIYTKDKKSVCIFSERDWEELIREYIGDDAVRYYRERKEAHKEMIADLKSVITEYEENIE